MKSLIVALLLLICIPCMAQESTKFGAFGLGYGNSPKVIGFAALGLPLTADQGTISYTAMRVGVVKDNPKIVIGDLKLTYSVNEGLAHRVLKFTPTWSLWALTAPGVSFSGSDILANFQNGGMVTKANLYKGWGLIIPVTAETQGVTKLAVQLGFSKRF
jgi:hypothetical protein